MAETQTELLNMDDTAGPLWSRLAAFRDSTSLQSQFPLFASSYPRLHDAIKQAFACALDISTGMDKADIAVYGLGRLCLEDFTEIVFLVENAFGYGALKLLRGFYERLVVTEIIIENPSEEAARFYDYYVVDERRWNRRGKTVYSDWNEDPSDLAKFYDEKIDEFKYEPCAACGKPPQQSWTKYALDALARQLGNATADAELQAYGKELKDLYFFCASLPNPYIHASMFSILQRLTGTKEKSFDPGNYALSYAHLLLLLALDAQNRRFELGMDSALAQLHAARSVAWPVPAKAGGESPLET